VIRDCCIGHHLLCGPVASRRATPTFDLRYKTGARRR
jgi:hypothetical protein